MQDGRSSHRQDAVTAAYASFEPCLRRVGIVIPAWQPSMLLSTLVRDLLLQGFATLVVVDDGSSAAAQPVFAALATMPGVEVLRHATNRGKGRALKTAFRYMLTHWPGLLGVVTADADGQHATRDIRRVAEKLLGNNTRPGLGSRSFERNVPLRSRLGNTLTRRVFGVVTGVRLRDTQTGLRGLPLAFLPALLALDGERYEYEMTMLAHLCRSGQRPAEVPIETIYIENNRGSHLHPVWDSMRIYFALLRSFAVFRRGAPV